MFQSTHPHGVRQSGRNHINLINHVSIHAPTRGATPEVLQKHLIMMFQSTHPHGVRRCSPRGYPYRASFNPRTHTGCDQEMIDRIGGINGFNPRTHTGCDGMPKGAKYGGRQFQSTHPHGVRH